MRILFAQRELILRAGSEMFTIEAARALHSRGHEVVLWAQRYGELAGALQAYGIPVVRTLPEVPWTPDIIHGQHHMQTMAALSFFHGIPVIYHCHGKPWIATPPHHRLIRHYLVMTQGMLDDMETTHHIPAGKVTVLVNAINLERFQRTRTPPPQIRRAVAFGNNFLPGPEMDRLGALCGEKGIALDVVGLHLRNTHARPEHLLQDYDLAFAVGRCALEAMACGCAVIPLTSGMAGHMILPETFQQWAASNFAPRIGSPADFVNGDWLQEELSRYRTESVQEVTRRVRTEHDQEHTVSVLESLYEKIIHEPAPPQDATADLRETGLYLSKLSLDVDLSHAAAVEAHALSEQRARYGQISRHAEEAVLHDEKEKKQKLRESAGRLEARLQALQEKNSGLAMKWNTTADLLRRSLLGRLFLSRIHRRLKSATVQASAAPPASGEKA